MKQGYFKNVILFFLFLIFFIPFLGSSQKASAIEIKYDAQLRCLDNAVAPLDNLLDIQTFLSCNGFNPGPMDGLRGSKTDNAIISFQTTVVLSAAGVVGPSTKHAIRAFSSTSLTFPCRG